MKVYHYNREHHYSGESEARLDPLETKIQGSEVYLVPANSTIKKPPMLKDNEVAVWDGVNWKLDIDRRGTYYDKTTKAEIKIEEIGIMPGSNMTSLSFNKHTDIWSGDGWVSDIKKEEEMEREYKKSMAISLKQVVDAGRLLNFDMKKEEVELEGILFDLRREP